MRFDAVPWYCWMILDGLGIVAVVVLALVGIHPEQAAPAIATIVVSGLAAQAYSRSRRAPSAPTLTSSRRRARRRRLPPLPPSGLVALLLLLPFALFALTRRA